MPRRILLLAAALLAVAAAPAGAATICVPNDHAAECGPTATSLQGAVDIAAGSPAARDTIRIAAGLLAAENVLVSAANPVDIVGAGRGPGGTVLVRGLAANWALDIQSPTSTVSNLRVNVTGVAGPTNYESGIYLSAEDVVAHDVTVAGGPGMSLGSGVLMRPGTVLRRSMVEVPIPGANDAVSAAEDTLLEDVDLAGAKMIDARDSGSPVVVRRLRSSQPSEVGIAALAGTTVDVSDALIRLSGGPDSYGLDVSTFGGADATITARHLTVVGSGDPTEGGTAVYASGDSNSAHTALAVVRDSVLNALTVNLEARTFFAPASARIAIDHSSFDPARQSISGPGGEQIVSGAANLFVDPAFVDVAGLDFHLRAESPLVDRGFPGAGSTADLDGLPRPSDGNADGAAVRDIGAFEYQRPAAPPPSPDTAAPLFVILSRTLRLDRRGRVAVVLRGPANESAASTASLRLRSLRRLMAGTAQRRRRLTLARKRFSLRPSARTVVRVKVSRRNARRIRARKRLRVVLTVTVQDAAGNARTARKQITVLARRTPR